MSNIHKYHISIRNIFYGEISKYVDVVFVTGNSDFRLLHDAQSRSHRDPEALQPFIGQTRQLEQADLGLLEGRRVFLVAEILQEQSEQGRLIAEKLRQLSNTIGLESVESGRALSHFVPRRLEKFVRVHVFRVVGLQLLHLGP